MCVVAGVFVVAAMVGAVVVLLFFVRPWWTTRLPSCASFCAANFVVVARLVVAANIVAIGVLNGAAAFDARLPFYACC